MQLEVQSPRWGYTRIRGAHTNIGHKIESCRTMGSNRLPNRAGESFGTLTQVHTPQTLSTRKQIPGKETRMGS